MLDLDMRKKNLNRWNILGAFFFFFFVLCFFIHRLNFPIPRSQHIHCVETYIDYLTLCMLKVLISPDQHIQFVEEWGYVKSKTSLNVPCMEQQSERTSKQKWQSECFVSMQTSLFVFIFFLRLLFLNLGQRRWLPLLFFSFFSCVSGKFQMLPISTFNIQRYRKNRWCSTCWTCQLISIGMSKNWFHGRAGCQCVLVRNLLRKTRFSTYEPHHGEAQTLWFLTRALQVHIDSVP